MAITEFQRALQQSENVPESHFGIAKAYQKLGDLKKAKAHILKAESNIASKRDDYYNEYLNEIYRSEIVDFKHSLEN